MQVKLECFKCAVAFFFLFFLHGTSIGNGQQGISYNVLQLINRAVSSYVMSACLLGAVRCLVLKRRVANLKVKHII